MLARPDVACDVLLLVVTETEELALRTAADEAGIEVVEREMPLGGRYLDLGMVGTDRVFAARSRMGTHGHQAAAYRALLLHTVTQATALIQVGMAFGVSPGTQRLGDVLIGRSLVPYDDRAVRDGDAAPYNDYTPLRRRHAKLALVEMLLREAGREKRDHAVHVGAMLSGSARIYSARFRDQLVAEIPPARDLIVGGEMEGLGIVSVSPADQPLWAIVKGISDFADTERDAIIDGTKMPACLNAARFVLTALRHRAEPAAERSR